MCSSHYSTNKSLEPSRPAYLYNSAPAPALASPPSTSCLSLMKSFPDVFQIAFIFVTISSNPSSYHRLHLFSVPLILSTTASAALSALRRSTNSPSPLHTASFSAGLIVAASPLVEVATKILAPSHAFSPSLTTPILSSCHPYLNSSFFIFRPCRTRHMLSQMPFPTIHTDSGRCSATFCSSTSTPASISTLLSSLASLVARVTILVWPSAYSLGRSRSSSGAHRRGVQPELWRSFQKRFEGWAYA